MHWLHSRVWEVMQVAKQRFDIGVLLEHGQDCEAIGRTDDGVQAQDWQLGMRAMETADSHARGLRGSGQSIGPMPCLPKGWVPSERALGIRRVQQGGA